MRILALSLLALISFFGVSSAKPTTTVNSSVKSYSATTTIKASGEQCWRAWTTNSELLKWLGTSNVSVSKGGDFLVSSRLPYLSGRHKVLEVVPNKSLKLQWCVDGWATEAVIKFAEKGEATEITVLLEVPTEGAPEFIEPISLAEHYFYFIGQSWDHALLNLKCVLEDAQAGVVIPRANNDHVVNLSIDIKSTPEKIYNSLIDANTLRKWNSGLSVEGTEIDPKVGGVYTYGWYPKGTPKADIKDGPQRILKLEKNKFLSVDWYGGTEVATVSWKLEPLKDGVVRVHFKHATILGHSHGNVWSYRSGWTSSLYALKWFMERGELEKSWFRKN